MIDKCSPSTCPKMAAGTKYEYLWQDNINFKKPTLLCASEYMINLMEWVQITLDDPSIFAKDAKNFPPDFKDKARKIYTRLFRIFAHMYYSHFQQITADGFEIDWNSCFKHFYYFIIEFHLVDPRELLPLERVINLFGEKVSPTSSPTLAIPQLGAKLQGTRKESFEDETDAPISHLQFAQESVDKYEKMIEDECTENNSSSWDVETVCTWLSKLENGDLQEYCDAFRKNKIQGADLADLTEDNLKTDLTIEPLGHRKQIIRAIKLLKK